jgi:hypothetical protein
MRAQPCGERGVASGRAARERAPRSAGVSQPEELVERGLRADSLPSRVENGSVAASFPRPVDHAIGSSTPSTTTALTRPGNRFAYVTPRYEP